MSSITMTTPIANLPLKTSTDNELNNLDDPLIQNVLKEFEEDYNIKMVQQNEISQQPQQLQQPQHLQQSQQQQQQQHLQQSQQFNQQLYNTNNIFDIKIIKKTLILTIIIFLIYYSNIISIITKNIPLTFSKYFENNEQYINIILLFIIIYAMIYFDII